MRNEAITHEFLMWAMCAGHQPSAKFDLYPVEGGTAAMCYVFKALKNARLLNAGDTIAIATPIFTPELEMPHLEDYALKQVLVASEAEDRFQLTGDEPCKTRPSRRSSSSTQATPRRWRSTFRASPCTGKRPHSSLGGNAPDQAYINLATSIPAAA